MKKLALILLLGSLSPIALHAHCGSCGVEKTQAKSYDKDQIIDNKVAAMTESLKLSAKQQAEIKKIIGKRWDAKMKAHETGKEALEKERAKTHKEIRKTLNKEQKAKWDELFAKKPDCCPSPWGKCPTCAAKTSGKACCPLAGKEGHTCPPKAKSASCCPTGEKK